MSTLITKTLSYSFIRFTQDDAKPHQINIIAEVDDNGWFYTDVVGRFCFISNEGCIYLPDGSKKNYKRFSALANKVYTIDALAMMNANLIGTVKSAANTVSNTVESETIQESETATEVAVTETLDQTITTVSANSINKYNQANSKYVTTKTDSFTAFNRSFASYNDAYNFCLTSDLDPSYIISELPYTPSESLLKLDLQLFASNSTVELEPTQTVSRNIYESNYDTVSIQTINGEIIARIHPSEEHDNMHKVCYSSDDYIYIPDSDIISISPISYNKSRTKKGVSYRNFGTSLELSYIIETTKYDDEPDINYSNITKQINSNLDSVFNTFNLWQKQGYKNISIGTIVKQNDNDIIEDYSYTLEATINNNEMDRLKKQREQLNAALQELSIHKEFIKKYKVEPTFKKFTEDQQNINKDESGLYWYEMTLRPLSPYCQPKGHIEYDDSKGHHGIIAYDRPLTIIELEEYELSKWDMSR